MLFPASQVFPDGPCLCRFDKQLSRPTAEGEGRGGVIFGIISPSDSDVQPIQTNINIFIHHKGIIYINPLKTKRKLLYLNTQFVPRGKHFSYRL